MESVKNAGFTTFDYVVMDLDSHASVRRAVKELPDKIDTLFLNDGGLGAETPSTEHGATPYFEMNVLGHAVLLEGLLKAGKLSSSVGGEMPRVIYSYSGITRSVWLFTGSHSWVGADVRASAVSARAHEHLRQVDYVRAVRGSLRYR